MSLLQIIALSAVEIVGGFGFVPFAIGTIGYIGVVIMLIISLQGSTILMVN